MLIKTVFSGFGGQGVILMGYLLAIAGMYEEKNVTCLPSYGAEVRGGPPVPLSSSPPKKSPRQLLRNLNLPY